MSHLPSYPRLLKFTAPAARSLQMKYLNRKAPFTRDLEVLTNSTNALHAKARDEYEEAPEDVLRWTVVTNMSKSALSKEVLRKRLRRRWDAAFLQALKQRGYDRRGRMVAEGDQRMEMKGLRGTLELHIYNGMGFDEQFERLVQKADAVVDALGKKQYYGKTLSRLPHETTVDEDGKKSSGPDSFMDLWRQNAAERKREKIARIPSQTSRTNNKKQVEEFLLDPAARPLSMKRGSLMYSRS